MSSLRRAALAGVALAAGVALVVPGVANATPSSGVTGTIISKTTIDGKDYILRRITIASGGSTGWHYHDGTLYAFVEQGTLTHDESNCQVDASYGPGSTFIEPSGADHGSDPRRSRGAVQIGGLTGNRRTRSSQGDAVSGPAVANGYRNANELRIESALDPLRNRPDFKKLMAELEKTAPPRQERSDVEKHHLTSPRQESLRLFSHSKSQSSRHDRP